MSATLYIVSTPIGNLSDFSSHAQCILATVSFIICEDTRHSLKLLQHFSIKNSLQSLHLYNEKNKIDYLLTKLLKSDTKSAALISDAGMPAICDPGSYLVEAAHKNNIQILVIPGPSSMPAALAAGGFIQPRTVFSGFLPKQKADQFKEFELWTKICPCIAVFFESPARIYASLCNIVEFFSHRYEDLNKLEICISKEISKKFEEHRRSSIISALAYYAQNNNICGEFVLSLNLASHFKNLQIFSLAEIAQQALDFSKLHQSTLKIACKEFAEKYNFSAKEIYAQVITLIEGENG